MDQHACKETLHTEAQRTYPLALLPGVAVLALVLSSASAPWAFPCGRVGSGEPHPTWGLVKEEALGNIPELCFHLPRTSGCWTLCC